jgi:glycosyltransferase involved in cell wall biosynthesis
VRVTLALPFLGRTGGVRLVLQYANFLHDKGHRACVVYPRKPYRFHFSRRDWRAEYRRTRTAPKSVPWFSLRAPLLRVPRIRNAFLPDADVIVAASWPIAIDIARLARCKGRGVHLLMHHEAGTGPEERIRGVYRLPLWRIALSESVRAQIQTEYGADIQDVVSAGVDPAVFFPDGRNRPDTALMIVHPAVHKGGQDGLAVFSWLAERRPGLHLLACGTMKPLDWPERFPFLLHPNDVTLRLLYSSASVFLYPSRYEGFGLPPLEAMACGCPVVSTRVGAVPEYGQDGYNALLVDPGDVRGMAGRIEMLLDDSGLRQTLIAGGIETARLWSIARAARCFEAALDRAGRSTS